MVSELQVYQTHTHTRTHPGTLQYYNNNTASNLHNSSDLEGYISAFNQYYDTETYKIFENWFNIHGW